MFKITLDEVKKLANLSSLTFNDDELAAMQKELESILKYVDKLKEIDVDGVEPTIQVTGLQNVTRADQIKEQISTKELMKNVPETEGSFIKVPKVL